MAETPIVSPTLQQDFRTTFPSQVSSGRDLHVSDVIVPIVDFSSTATGSTLAENLNNAIDYSISAGAVNNTTTTIINTTGFWRVYGYVNIVGTGQARNCYIKMNDGTTTKNVFIFQGVNAGGIDIQTALIYDKTFYIHTNHSLILESDNNQATITYACRQIADINGTATVPLNYTAS
jgi:hypothetical protein